MYIRSLFDAKKDVRDPRLQRVRMAITVQVSHRDTNMLSI